MHLYTGYLLNSLICSTYNLIKDTFWVDLASVFNIDNAAFNKCMSTSTRLVLLIPKCASELLFTGFHVFSTKLPEGRDGTNQHRLLCQSYLWRNELKSKMVLSCDPIKI